MDPRCAAAPGGASCRARALPGKPYCAAHLGPLKVRRPRNAREFFEEWRTSIETVVGRRLRGESPPKDDHDPDLVRAVMPLALPLYSLYWRAEVHGIENVPTEGP